MTTSKVPLRERIAAMIETRSDGHMLWLGTFGHGTGWVFVERGRGPASVARVLWEEMNGSLTGRIQRQCDEERCVNPEHFALKRKISLTPGRIRGEEDLIAHWTERAVMASRRLVRTTGCSTAGISLEEVQAEALLQLLLAIRTDERVRDVGEDPRYVSWLLYKRLLDWLAQQSHSNKAWALLRSDGITGDLPHYERSDLRYSRPELAALDALFLDAFDDAVSVLTATEIAYLSIGVERSGEKIRDAADRLNLGYQTIRKNRRAAEMKLLGLLQARGWFTGPDGPVESAVGF